MINKDKIEVTVCGPDPTDKIAIFLNWDACLEDWKVVFKTILINQTFTEDTLKELFFDEDYHQFIDERSLCEPE